MNYYFFAILIFFVNSKLILPKNEPKILLNGRFSDENCFDWPSTNIELLVKSTEYLGIHLNDYDNRNFYNLYKDGELFDTFRTDNKTFFEFHFPATEDVIHFKLSRRNEGIYKKSCFNGIEVNESATFEEFPERKKFLFIGDSLTAGFCSNGLIWEEANQEHDNSEFSWAIKVSDHFDATYQSIAYSGKGLVVNSDDDKTGLPMPYYLYDTCASDKEDGEYNFQKFLPYAVFIFLGANDYIHRKENTPTKEEWVSTFDELLTNLTTRLDNDAYYFLVCGWPAPEIQPNSCIYNEIVKENWKTKINVTTMNFDGLTDLHFGCDFHPNNLGYEKFADYAIPIIQNMFDGIESGGFFPTIKTVVLLSLLLLFIL